VRHVTGEEPVSVSARATMVKDLDETLAFSMTFPSGVLAACVSTYAAHVSRVDVATETGAFGLEPALYYHGIKGFRSDGKPFAFPDIDQFAAEMDAFAACVRDGRPTTPPGEEGLRDVRIIVAALKSARENRPLTLSWPPRNRRPEPSDRMYRPPIREPRLIAVEAPTQD